MAFDICLHEVCVRVGVRCVITKFSWMDSLPNFVTNGAPLRALRARELRYKCMISLAYSQDPKRRRRLYPSNKSI